MADRVHRFEVPADRPFGRLSKGQRGAVMLSLALGHEPELLVLDDPTLGLDVVARDAVFREVIGDLADRGTSVLVTTHDLRPIEGLADRVAILHGGRLALAGEPGAEVPTVHFFVEAERIVRLDFATGERRVVAGPGATTGERISIR